eukprot:m.49853 g.49853  ORF g.49853 m.49853 type:complete len:352 (+) comp34037_c0_seq5:2636-3691(+)
MRYFVLLIVFSSVFVYFSTSLTCSDLDLLSGGHPTVFDVKSATGNSPETSNITWTETGEVDTSLTAQVSCNEESEYLMIQSNGIPAHNVGRFPMRTSTTGRPHPDNPNSIMEQNYEWRILKTPKIKAEMPKSVLEDHSALPMGPIGFARNGVPFYNLYNNEYLDAVSRQSNGFEVMDLCDGHPDKRGHYHHHYQQQKDGCLFGGKTSQIPDSEEGQRSPKLGYAFDGIPIYGPRGEGGKVPTDLDICNGRHDSELGQYVYHITELKPPYVIGCYRYENPGEPRPHPPMEEGEQKEVHDGDHRSGLSRGAVAGIVGACLCLTVVASIVIFFLYKSRKSRSTAPKYTLMITRE